MVTGLTKIWAGVNDTVTELATAGASLPSGLIAIWKGSTSTIPDGWILCDGQNGTPDLRDKFVLGAGNSYSVDSTGGEETHVLTVEEMPSHSHDTAHNIKTTIFKTRQLDGAGYPNYEHQYVYSANNANEDYAYEFTYNKSILSDTGGNSAHNNMPPYYALCYIMKT